jgi:hypothetical protein
LNKKWVGFVAALMSAMLLMSGCATALLGPGKTADTATAGASASASEDAATIVVADVNGVAIYKDAYNSLYDQMLYSAYYSGQNVEDETVLSTIRQAVLDQLISDEVCKQKFTELGYDVLTDEEKAQAEKDMIDYLVTNVVEYYYLDQVTAGLEEGYTDEELRAAEEAYAETLFEGADITREGYLENFTYQIVYEKAYDAQVGNIAPTDQEIKDKYNEYVSADEATISATPTSYITSVNSGMTVYYIPEGVRRVRQVLIPMDEEMTGAISVLRENNYGAEADILLTQGLSAIEEDANTALGKLESGATFDELITEYAPDTDMPDGYPVMEGATDYDDAYVAGALALTAIGEHSGLIATDDGYYILEYYADETAGPVSYDKVKDGIAEELKATLQDEAWQELLDQWKSAATIQTYEGNL